MSTPLTVLPEELVLAAKHLTQDVFAASYDDTMILLVNVVDATSTVCKHLAESATSGERLQWSDSSSAFATRGASAAALAMEAVRARAKKPAWSASVARSLLAMSTYFAAPIRRRSGLDRPFSFRVSVGRSRENDVVLRDTTVSKAHAWFERDTRGTFFVADAGSRNRTLLNGITIGRSLLHPLEPGDEITFGEIVSVFCPAATLWEALR